MSIYNKIELKYMTPELYVSESVAVVGSSKILLENEWGKEIDSHDDVIRFNRAPTCGFEDFVGSKTTIRVANNHVFNNTKVTDKRFPEPEKNYPKNFIKNQKGIKIVNVGGKNNEGWADRHQNIDESSKSFLVDFKTLHVKNEKLRTVGFYFVKILIESGVVPHLYGFGMPEGADSSHYWVDRDKKSVCHDYNNERSILKKWEKEGKVKLFL